MKKGGKIESAYYRSIILQLYGIKLAIAFNLFVI